MPAYLLTLIACFASVALLSGFAAGRMLSGYSADRRRLRKIAGRTSESAVDEDRPLADATVQKWQRLARMVPKSPKDMSRLQRRLGTAGYRSPSAAVIFSLAEVACPAFFGIAALVVVGFHSSSGWLAAGLSALVAFFVPGLVLERMIAARRKQIRNGLPDVLDLLIVCLEAGCSLDQAVVKATEELHLTYPALADELRILITETRAGKPRMEAFKNLAERTQEEDIRALVAMLVQTDRFGTSVAQTLRTFAQTSRTKRRQRAEEQAAKVAVKLLFPLVFCLFPALYVVILGPAVVQYVRIFVGQVMQQVH